VVYAVGYELVRDLWTDLLCGGEGKEECNRKPHFIARNVESHTSAWYFGLLEMYGTERS